MTDEEALNEIDNALGNWTRAQRDAFDYIEERLARLREREGEEADPHCGYCDVRRSEHGSGALEEATNPAACLVFREGPL